jgi:hypothetical protein
MIQAGGVQYGAKLLGRPAPLPCRAISDQLNDQETGNAKRNYCPQAAGNRIGSDQVGKWFPGTGH